MLAILNELLTVKCEREYRYLVHGTDGLRLAWGTRLACSLYKGGKKMERSMLAFLLASSSASGFGGWQLHSSGCRRCIISCIISRVVFPHFFLPSIVYVLFIA